MKFLIIYKDKDKFVIERVNESVSFSIEPDSFKRYYTTESGLVKGLQTYQPIIQEYDVIVEKALESIVNNLYGTETL